MVAAVQEVATVLIAASVLGAGLGLVAGLLVSSLLDR